MLALRDVSSPVISAVVATYNEEGYIEKCLRGLLDQTLSPEQYEIIVVDGCSTDGTRQIVQSIDGFGTRVKLLLNDRRFQVFAWNIGMQAARGEYVVFISAHTEYAPDYLASCLDAARRTEADCVGAVQVPVGTGHFGGAIAWAMQSPLGVGNARFRYAKQESVVESVFGGCFKKGTLLRLGGYNESNRFDEDGDLSYRLRSSGGTIIVCPSIRVRYRVRSSLGGLCRQMFNYGYWRRKTQLQHGAQAVPLRVFAPPLLVVFLLGSLIGAAVWRISLSLVVPLSYSFFLLVASLVAWKDVRQGRIAIYVPLVLAAMHLSYGLGYWSGTFSLVREP
jgi:succinoglycan biosynthesis protein ExoA